jgi:uncharacterized membrane protein
VEELLRDALGVLVPVVEACGAAVIVVGALWAFVRFVVAVLRDRDARACAPVRLTLGRFLALGLEFQLASDVWPATCCGRRWRPASASSVSLPDLRRLLRPAWRA